MLKSLAISNYVLIENLEIDFPDGLIIITGETGAGKSILLGAISLLLGAKADKEILKDIEKNCIVEGTFQVTKTPETDAIFIENSLEPTNEIVLRRVISPAGRSRSFVNDEPVTVQFLKAISEKIIDIHAQHEHLLLADNRFQLSALDSYAGNSIILEQYQSSWTKLKELEKECVALQERLSKEEQELEYNRYRLNQLEEAKLVSGELEEKEAEFNLLSNAEEIKSSLFQVIELLNPNEISLIQNLKEITALLEKRTGALPQLEQLNERTEVAMIELKEIEREISTIAESVTVNPQRAAALEERLSHLYTLLKRFGAESVEGLIAIKEELESKLESGESVKERLLMIEKEVERGREEMEGYGEELTASRAEASVPFALEMQRRIRELEMPQAIFEVKVSQNAAFEYMGRDSVELFFTANTNLPARELSKVASGGELSRIMLALKSIMAVDKGMPTLIFDEIDIGVSGSIADKMGSLIGELSHKMQVFAITHLPQIASKGRCHLLVY
ncbi:MAG: DNA repair protein RecN, partial [Bacteroidales bacterium]